MLFARFLLVSQTVLFCAFFTHCARHRPEGPRGTMSAEQAENLVVAQATTGLKFANGYTTSATSQFIDVSNDLPGCTPNTSGDLADGDGDGLPVDGKYSINCNESSINVSGGYSVQDKNDSEKLPKGGFKVDINGMDANAHSEGITFTSSTEGIFESTFAATSAATKAEIFASASGGGQAMEVEYWLDTELTPSNMATPQVVGGASISGFVVIRSQGADFTLGVSTANLIYGGCVGNFFRSGTASFVDGSGNKAVVNYANCVAAWTYNSQPLRTSRRRAISSSRYSWVPPFMTLSSRL